MLVFGVAYRFTPVCLQNSEMWGQECPMDIFTPKNEDWGGI
jgi:hypothetical protein